MYVYVRILSVPSKLASYTRSVCKLQIYQESSKEMKQFCYISLFMSSFVILQAAAITNNMNLSPEDKLKDCAVDNTFYWPESIKNLSMSCTKLQFSSKNYILTEHLKITAVNNFSIVGNGATFECNCSSIIIKDSNSIRIENARFLNCGCSTHDTTTVTMSAISLHNSSFVTIINVLIEDSDGYGIMGVNLIGKSSLENITIFHTNYNKFSHSKQPSVVGGIVLFYENTFHSNVSTKLLVKHCTISNISNNHKMKHESQHSEIPSELLNSVVGLMFYQQPETIEIQIHNLTVTNTTSVNGSLLLVSVNSDSLNLAMSRSIFVNNKNSLHPMINFLLNTTYPGSLLTIINSEFGNNSNYTHILKMNNVANDSVVLVVKNVKMVNNIVTVGIFNVSGIIPLLKDYTEFSNNMASIVFSFGKYVQLDEEAQLLISNNKYDPAQKTLKRFIFEKTNLVSKECPLQFNVTTSTVNITFCNNVGYYREMHGNYLEYNCTWNEGLNNHFSPQNEIYKNAMNDCGAKIEYFRWSSSFYLCNITSNYAIKHNKQYIVPHLYYHHDKLHPGQTVSVKLIHLRYNVSVYTNSEGTKFTDIAPLCRLSTLHKVDVVYNSCTELRYTIKSKITSNSMCLLTLKAAAKMSTTLIFKINISSCPIGFTLDYNLGECICNPKLEATMKGIICSISDMTFTLRGGWMSKINKTGNRNEIIYTDFCCFDYCTLSPHKIITLNNVDSQCLPGRTGIVCGQCAKGLSTVFGTSQCKKCSNLGLFMIPIFAITGLLIVITLFALNLTIVNGNFYGFIFFVNTVSISVLELFVTKKEIAYTLISLLNLDLGIEVCFYNGMTTYASMWLQFLFPIYLLSIVAGLVVASRYSSKIERITRKKVIPVIATLYLLSYNKIMIITFKGLFSFVRIHYLSSGETKIYWPVDTDISVSNWKFILLFLFCGIVLVILIIPTNIVLLFTRKCYHFRFVAAYLRPFIDVYQAPFKDNYRYFLGFEFLLQVVVYIVKFVRTQYTAAIFCALIILYVAYLSWHKPFKNNFSMLLYLLYIFLLGGLTITYMHYEIAYTSPSETFEMILNLLVYLAFFETLLILVHHWWKYHLCYCKVFIKIEKYTKAKLHKYFMYKKKSAPKTISLEEIHAYAEYQEELLALSPNV